VTLSGARIHITGTVQGVGFRPFVYGLATRLGLKGWVRNTSGGVDIQVDGTENILDEFSQALCKQHPPLAKIDAFTIERTSPNGYTIFEILHSEPIPGEFIPISPDVSICDDCYRELFDPGDRRYLYPFINCTNCGPRFTIVQDIPYDRPKTTMAPFEMCPDCKREYGNPLDRRFHAQPVACPSCGPHIWIEESKPGYQESTTSRLFSGGQDQVTDFQVIKTAQQYLLEGKIIAIKGLGGFHLACDATNSEAVTELRHRKLRVDKPFALMVPDLKTLEQHCFITAFERRLLESRERPIVLLWRKPESNIALSVAPNQDTLGIMLPYTPLHHLLFTRWDTIRSPETYNPDLTALVMTSGNLKEEPIAITNQEARVRLSTLADFFLMHDREIQTRCDDSVVRQNTMNFEKTPTDKPPSSDIYFLRRSRGYAPGPIRLPWKVPQILATGPELKNTFCLSKEDYAFISHHIGDMENYETLQSFEEGIDDYENLFRIKPEVIACDQHPNYLATRYAINRSQTSDLPLFQIQHHHAHIAACMADNRLTGDHPVIGVALDGTGYGDDGHIWGGEFLITDYRGYQRYAHLVYTPLPGGDAGIKNPFRIALAQLWHNGIDWDDDLPPVKAACGDDLSMLKSMLEHEINTPLTSSIGRLFDAAAALTGIRSHVNYEAQAAIEFEACVNLDETQAYTFEILKSKGNLENQGINPFEICTKTMFTEIIADLRAGTPVNNISAKFHNGLANMIVEICQSARDIYGIQEVALSGGVWQNMTLLGKTTQLLSRSGFRILVHKQIPPNDGGLALGQAAITAQLFKN
jgi:hydrogenase maturation protein HypF